MFDYHVGIVCTLPKIRSHPVHLASQSRLGIFLKELIDHSFLGRSIVLGKQLAKIVFFCLGGGLSPWGFAGGAAWAAGSSTPFRL